jgi:acetyltransferase-like isoleucine patch superfamily enzyme
MRLLERLYRSPMGRVMSLVGHAVAQLQSPFMVYGLVDPATGQFRKYTRMSSTVVIMNKKALSVGDHVWVWHYSILDATEGLVLEEGCQIGAWVGIFTHGSERAIRLLGRQFVHIPNTERKGYTRGSVHIGAYTFVGAGSVILPGVTIGKGCLIGTGTLVTKSVPDYSIVVGSPGQVKGSTLDLDSRSFAEFDFSDTYYDANALEIIKKSPRGSSA